MNPLQFAGAGSGLASALSFGVADFMGGLASRRSTIFSTAVALNLVGGGLTAVIALLRREPLPEIHHWIWALVAGSIGVIGLLALYMALSGGKMGLAAPVAGVVAAAVPVLFGIVAEGLLPWWKFGGFALALGGVWLLSSSGGKLTLSRELLYALVAGTGFGIFYILINLATPSEHQVFWPLFGSKIASLIIILGVAFARKENVVPPRSQFPLLIVMGVLDMGGNIFYMIAAQISRLDVSAVLASLYPAATVLCAWIFLKEALGWQQLGGVVLILAAIPLIAG